jgi:hypothetical protein
MDKLFLFPRLFLILGAFGLMNACTEDCPDGYSGEDCEIRESDPFIATYEGFVNCGPQNEYTTLDIYRESGPFEVSMVLVYPPDFTIRARVKGDTLVISEQVVPVAYTTDTSYYILFDSEGYLHGDTLDFSLVLINPGIPDQQKITCVYEVLK